MAEGERHALVVGAGLAGSAVCAVLAQRGWRLTLVDAAEGPAQGASALPVGMLSPHVTRAPTPLSRLSQLGVADTLAELQRLVPQGHGWQACEVDNLNHDVGRWPAALVRPAALVQAWLKESAEVSTLVSLWGERAASLRQGRSADGMLGWELLRSDGTLIARAPVVIVCAALASLRILTADGAKVDAGALPLRPVKGQMTLGPVEGAPWAERPQRHNGVLVPSYEDAGLAPLWPARIWSMGSTYTRGDQSTHVTQEDHERNALSLQQFHPAAAQALRAAMGTDRLMGWAQVRCASLDRLPLAGAVPDSNALAQLLQMRRLGRSRLSLAEVPRLPDLFMLTALGSRGLTLAHWCARALGASLEGAAGETEPDLLHAIDPARFAWKAGRRQSTA